MKKAMCVLLIGICLILVSGVLSAQDDTALPEEGGVVDEAKTSEGLTFWQTIKAGGICMLVIGLCSILVLTIGIERFMSTRVKVLFPLEVMARVKTLAMEKKFAEAVILCEQNPCFITNMLGTALRKADHTYEEALAAVEETGAKEAGDMQQRIVYLSVIASVTPMIGLLGTVIGMIQAFNVIAFKGGAGKPTLLAAGISKALITTAFGLVVAIPAMVLFYYFKGKGANLMNKAELIVEDFFEIIYPTKSELAKEIAALNQAAQSQGPLPGAPTAQQVQQPAQPVAAPPIPQQPVQPAQPAQPAAPPVPPAQQPPPQQ